MSLEIQTFAQKSKFQEPIYFRNIRTIFRKNFYPIVHEKNLNHSFPCSNTKPDFIVFIENFQQKKSNFFLKNKKGFFKNRNFVTKSKFVTKNRNFSAKKRKFRSIAIV